MPWEKLGQVYKPKGEGWRKSHGFCPTPLVLNDRIRLFVGFWGEDEKCRIGTIDVAVDDPTEFVDFSQKPIVALGKPGYFDSDGMIPSCAVKVRRQTFLTYTGWQALSGQMKRLAFSGMLVSDGEKFRRCFELPILDRNAHEPFLRSMPWLCNEYCYYATAPDYHELNGWAVPKYTVASASAYDLDKDWMRTSKPTVALEIPDGAIALARPSALQNEDGSYDMWISVRELDVGYRRIAHATSRMGKKFAFSEDESKELTPSPDGWDSEMVCFGAVVRAGGRKLMFYCGNNYGETGFGIAEWRES